MVSYRKAAAVVATIAAALWLSSCTASTPSTEAEVTSVAQTAVVEVRDITAALTLPATVTARLDYDVTSPMEGEFVSDGFSFSVQSSTAAEDVAMFVGSTVDELYVTSGQGVAAGLPLLRATATGFLLRADVDPKDLPRLVTPPVKVRAQLEGGSAAFDCALINPLPTFRDAGAAYYGCIVPAGITVVEGMTGRVVLVLSDVSQVLALPISSVSGTVDNGEVLMPDGEVKAVALGITDGQYIEIKDGLSRDDIVALPSPTLLDIR